jgi:integrase
MSLDLAQKAIPACKIGDISYNPRLAHLANAIDLAIAHVCGPAERCWPWNQSSANIRLYDLRHTAATLALTVGVSPKVVSEQLGHTSPAFTLDYPFGGFNQRVGALSRAMTSHKPTYRY